MRKSCFFPVLLAAFLLGISCSQPADNIMFFMDNELPFETVGTEKETVNEEKPEKAVSAEINVWISNKDGSQNGEYESLHDALDWLRNNASGNGSYTILLGRDEVILPQVLNFGTAEKSVNINLVSVDGNEKQISLEKPGILFLTGPHITLTLDDGITLKGRSDNNSGALVYIQKNGRLVMNDGSTVRDNASREYGAVAVEGTFIMNGGEISGNSKRFSFYSGGGVSLIDGVFIMNGGIIRGNSASSGGGVGLSSRSGKNPVFIMNGGTITGNSGDWGGGVHVSIYGKFSMTGGAISGNFGIAGGGVSIEGAVWSSGEFIMTGGAISSNIAETNGGGIFSTQNVSAGKLVIGGNAVISGNSLSFNPFQQNGYGGGIYSAGHVTLQDNCVIEGNTAKGGAGVFLTLHQGSIIEQAFVMTGGTVRSNIAQEFGGGAALSLSDPFIQFHKTGGIIYGRDGAANANIVLNNPDINDQIPPENPRPKPGEDDQGEDNNSQGNDQGNGSNKKPAPPVNDNNILSGNGQAIAIVEFNNDIISFYARKETTAGPGIALSSTGMESFGWD